MKIILILENNETMNDLSMKIGNIRLPDIAHIVAKDDGTILKDRHNNAMQTFLNQSASILEKLTKILPSK